jgi:hypothetical protein
LSLRVCQICTKSNVGDFHNTELASHLITSATAHASVIFQQKLAQISFFLPVKPPTVIAAVGNVHDFNVVANAANMLSALNSVCMVTFLSHAKQYARKDICGL